MTLTEIQELTPSSAQRKAIADRARNEAWVDDNYPSPMPDGWQPERRRKVTPSSRRPWLT